jgi:hypothetical protein
MRAPISHGKSGTRKAPAAFPYRHAQQIKAIRKSPIYHIGLGGGRAILAVQVGRFLYLHPP